MRTALNLSGTMMWSACLILISICLSAQVISAKGNDDEQTQIFGLSRDGTELNKDSYIESIVSNMTIEDLGVLQHTCLHQPQNRTPH